MHRLPRPAFSPIRTSLRTKVTLGVLIPLLGLLGVLVAVQLLRHRTAVLESATLIAANAGKVIEESLRHEIVESHFENIQSLIDAISRAGDFRVVYLLDEGGSVLFAPQGVGVGEKLSNEDPECLACHDLPEDERPSSVVVELGSGLRVFRSMVPMENGPDCIECHPDESEPLALLLTDTPLATLEPFLAADLWENLLWLVTALAVTILVVNLALNRLVLGRLKTLAGALADFGRGRHNLRLPAGDSDEIGRLAEAFNDMGEQVAREEEDNQALSADLRRENALRGELLKRLITAQEDERQRLAREIHDEVGQSLSGLALQLEVLQRYLHPDAGQIRLQVGRIQTLVASASDSMYDLIFDLRPAALDDLGLPAALRTLSERALSNTRIAFELQAGEFTGRLPTEMEVAIYRMFQEALNNVVRHASARHVSFVLQRSLRFFEGCIKDDGRGFRPDDPPIHGDRSTGLGLAGMKERAAQFGGTVAIDSDYGEGTRISIRIPLPGDEGDGQPSRR